MEAFTPRTGRVDRYPRDIVMQMSLRWRIDEMVLLSYSIHQVKGGTARTLEGDEHRATLAAIA
jgi:hypothetical protein